MLWSKEIGVATKPPVVASKSRECYPLWLGRDGAVLEKIVWKVVEKENWSSVLVGDESKLEGLPEQCNHPRLQGYLENFLSDTCGTRRLAAEIGFLACWGMTIF